MQLNYKIQNNIDFVLSNLMSTLKNQRSVQALKPSYVGANVFAHFYKKKEKLVYIAAKSYEWKYEHT